MKQTNTDTPDVYKENILKLFTDFIKWKMEQEQITPEKIARDLGIKLYYIHIRLSGKREMSISLMGRIFYCLKVNLKKDLVRFLAKENPNDQVNAQGKNHDEGIEAMGIKTKIKAQNPEEWAEEFIKYRETKN